MTEEQRNILFNRESDYLSVGVTETDNGYCMIPIPWENKATAYNMKTPNVYISKEDLLDNEIMSKLKEYRVIGFYIDVPLEDYSFLKEFPQIRDLNILKGDSIRDLTFLESLTECRMLYLENISIKNLDSILKIKIEKQDENIFDLPFVYIGLCNCSVEDTTGIDNQKLFFSEFLIWDKKGKNEIGKWKNVHAGTFRYYANLI